MMKTALTYAGLALLILSGFSLATFAAYRWGYETARVRDAQGQTAAIERAVIERQAKAEKQAGDLRRQLAEAQQQTAALNQRLTERHAASSRIQTEIAHAPLPGPALGAEFVRLYDRAASGGVPAGPSGGDPAGPR